MSDAAQAAVLGAIADLRDEVHEDLGDIKAHLAKLNGKVGEHERRFTLQDGAEAERARVAAVPKFATIPEPTGVITARFNQRDLLLFGGIFVSILSGHWEWVAEIIKHLAGAKP